MNKQVCYAVVKVRGNVDVRKEIVDTMTMLKLKRINTCVVLPKTPSIDGMIKKVKDYVTWGEISDKILERLVRLKSSEEGTKKIIEKIKKGKIKPVFRLSPPKKGYKSTKIPFPRGSLGYRGDKINDLVKRMM